MTSPGLAPTRHRLDQGGVVLLTRVPTTPAVAIDVVVGAGSRHDPPDLSGLSYVLSQVIDRGTGRRSADQVADTLESRGIQLSVRATRLAFMVTCSCLAEDFEAVFGLLAEILVDPALDERELDRRRPQMLTALRQDHDNPATVALDGLFELLYPDGHPYGRPSKGVPETVERLTAADLRAFHRARFAPDTTTLAIVGDVDPARAVEVAQAAFGDWPAAAGPAATLPDPRPDGRRRIEVAMRDKAQSDIAYGLITVDRRDPRYDAFSLMNLALGQYAMGGRLGRNIRERQGMAYYAFSVLDSDVIDTPLVVRAGVSPSNVERTVVAIDEEVARMARDGVDDEELADCVRYVIGSMPRRLETNAGIARFLQDVEFFDLGLDYDVRRPAELRQVTREQVAAAAATLSPDRAAVVVAGAPPAAQTTPGGEGSPS